MNAYVYHQVSPDPVLLDVTRLVSLRWTGRPPNGIDRVATEYLRHFGSRALAVVQHRGMIRVVGEAPSRRLFDLLGDSAPVARARIATLLASALAAPMRPRSGSPYLNVTHTDFDLIAHTNWVSRNQLKAVYLLHDLIPILHPEHCRPHAVTRHTGRVRAALRHGAGIIVGSAAVARDLQDYADQHGPIAPPVAIAGLAGATLGGGAQPRLAHGDFFLCVGTIESRKNHLLLLRVWDRLRARLGAATPRLVIAGRWGSGSTPFRDALHRSGRAGGLIQVLENCDDDALAGLMAGSRAVLMPSVAEGFGLPVAEALAMGVPVIASDLPCFREIGQGVPSLLDPRDVDAWVERIAVLDAPAAGRQRRIDALHGYRAPTWEEHFARVDPWLAAIAASTARVHDPLVGDAPPPNGGRHVHGLDLEV